MNHIIEEVRRFVEEETRKETSHYPTAYDLHFISVHDIAKILAEKLDADVEIVELAAWLHDIGSVMKGREDHHITGAEIAEEKLKELNYPKERIEKIKDCILNHRGSKSESNNYKFIESRIIAEADAVDAFNDVLKQFVVTLVHEKLGLEEAKKSVKRKLNNKWNQLTIPEAKEMAKPTYEAIMFLLGGGK